MIDENVRYSRTHEWAQLEDGVVTVGLSEYAVEQLGDIVYIELPSVGDEVRMDAAFGEIESVKAASDIYAPLSGTVVAINEGVADNFDVFETDAYGQGWLIKIKPANVSEYDSLMDAGAYGEFIKTQTE
jgi:glycine cleavage system H protein